MKTATRTRIRQFALVYQGGIANVFEMQDRMPPRRVMQGTFLACEVYATALMEMGAEMEVHFCNMAGDIRLEAWDTTREAAPFTDSMSPRFMRMAT